MREKCHCNSLGQSRAFSNKSRICFTFAANILLCLPRENTIKNNQVFKTNSVNLAGFSKRLSKHEMERGVLTTHMALQLKDKVLKIKVRVNISKVGWYVLK